MTSELRLEAVARTGIQFLNAFDAPREALVIFHADFSRATLTAGRLAHARSRVLLEVKHNPAISCPGGYQWLQKSLIFDDWPRCYLSKQKTRRLMTMILRTGVHAWGLGWIPLGRTWIYAARYMTAARCIGESQLS